MHLYETWFLQNETPHIYFRVTCVWVPESVIIERLKIKEEREKEVTVGINNDHQPNTPRFQIPEFRASTSGYKRSRSLSDQNRYGNVHTNPFSNNAMSRSYDLQYRPVTSTPRNRLHS